MQEVDLVAFRATPLIPEPFEHLIVPGFVKAEARAAIHADYPRIDAPGSFPVSELTYGPAFASLLATLTGPEVRAAFEEKFAIRLKDRPTTLTVRGRCGPKDGHIHTDQASKIITVLIYLNPSWEQSGGRLRLLRSAHDLDDVLVEVPPVEGTLVAFRRRDNSYHGHKPFLGPRRVIQLNWVTGQGARHYAHLRHRVSAWLKKLVASLRPQAAPGLEASPAGKMP